MNKILKSIIFTGLLLMGTTISCNLPFSDSPKDTETPTLTASPSETSTPAPTEFVPTASATPELAPLCEAGNILSTIQCLASIAEEGSTFCTNKRPYNLIFVNKGATYEALTRGFSCVNNGMKDVRQIVACTGKMASDFEVNVCDPACVIPTVEAKTTQCPPDYNYNSLQGCCTQGFQQFQQNCVVLKLRTTSCLVDCSVYTKKSTCNKNSIACEWNDNMHICEVRK